MPRAARNLRLWLVLWACFALACEAETTPTQLLVVVDTDLSVGQEDGDALRTIQVSVLRTDSDEEIVHPRSLLVSTAPKSPLEFALPLSFALTPQGLEDGALFRVVVTGQNEAGEDIAERQVITGFRKGASLRLDIFLAASCLRELCREQNLRTGLTCDVETGACARAPELRELPVAGGGSVGGYRRSFDGGAVWEDGVAAKRCARDADCDDALYCNGVEACDPGSLKANPAGCVSGVGPSCGVRETCDEASDHCAACSQNADGDGDHVDAKACGGSDCNDGDPAIAPGKEEICDGKDNDCDERTDVTSAGSVCKVAMAGADAGSVEGGALDGGVREASSEGGISPLDAGVDGGRLDSGKEAGAEAGIMDAGAMEAGPPDAGAPDANVPLVSGCTMGSTAACSSFINVSGVEVVMGSYGAVMDRNVGKGFENQINSADADRNAQCSMFMSIFSLPQEQTDKLLQTDDLKFDLYTVYRPANWPAGKVPIVTWGNGTCAQPESYGALLRYIASFGFVVVAPNSRWVGTGAEQKKALEFIFNANEDSTSPYYHKLDTTKVAAAGHSQGGQGTVAVASDARISNVILFNSAGGNSVSKPFLAVSGDRDLFLNSAAELKSAADAGTKSAWIWIHMVPGTGTADGHLTVMQQPERLAPASVAWLKLLLSNDAASKQYFVGASCKLCGHDAEFEFGQKGLE